MTTKTQQKIERGYNFCEKCSKNEASVFKIETHHIIYKSEKPKHEHIEHDLNKIVLCDECHKWYHDKKIRRNHLIEERKLYLLFGTDIWRYEKSADD